MRMLGGYTGSSVGWPAGWISEWLALCRPAAYGDVPAVWLAGSLTCGLRWLAGSTWFSVTVLARRPCQPVAFGRGQRSVYAQFRGPWSPFGQIQLLASAFINSYVILRKDSFKKVLQLSFGETCQIILVGLSTFCQPSFVWCFFFLFFMAIGNTNEVINILILLEKWYDYTGLPTSYLGLKFNYLSC